MVLVLVASAGAFNGHIVTEGPLRLEIGAIPVVQRYDSPQKVVVTLKNNHTAPLQINVHLHGILRDHLPPEAKGRATISLQDGATVGDLITQLGIKRRVIVALNGNQKPEKTHILHDDDQVSIFTVIGGG